MGNPIACIGQECTGILNFLERLGYPHNPFEIDFRCLFRVASFEIADEYSALQAGDPRLDGHGASSSLVNAPESCAES